MARHSFSSNLSSSEKAFLKAAIRLGKSRVGKASPNPSVGAIIVVEDEKGPIIVGRGVTADGGRPHGEVLALQQAGPLAKGATCYVSLEPCAHHGKTPPCVEALHKAGIARVIIALEDPDPRVSGKGSDFLREHGIEVFDQDYVKEIREEAKKANSGHVSRIVNKRPYITLKLALSQNDMIGISGKGMVPITGALSRRIVHGMRARSDAILVGVGTVLADNPDLTCRLNGMESWSPKRFVLDKMAETPFDAKLFDKISKIPLSIIVGPGAPLKRVEKLKQNGAEIRTLPTPEGRFDLLSLSQMMANEGITHLMVEGGSSVSSSFLSANLVDRAYIFKGSSQLEGEVIPAFSGGSDIFEVLQDNNLRPTETTIFKNDHLTQWER